ncbi:MAG: putative Fe-S cluster assembly protein SufT [Verrucomicrobia bacterium]|nr:MAG: putative Fe-S cluster assembly protein SufT [Verrucomicrobiota bacterium]
MHKDKEFTLTRDVEAILIPSGAKTTIPQGTPGVITQALGGSYTVATYQGLARVSEKDADALGLEKTAASNGAEKSVASSNGDVDEKMVWDQLKQCFDPEIPVNIVDLGLVYDCQLTKRPEAPGCGMGPAIAHDAQSKILTIDGVDEADVQLVWDPPWNQSMISEAGRMKLVMV